MKVYLGLGSLAVELPEKKVLDGLKRFVRVKGGDGYIEDLYSMSIDGKTMVTMPGFAHRVLSMCNTRQQVVIDNRIPLPDPDFHAAYSVTGGVWRNLMEGAMSSKGGVFAVPSIIGTARVVASMIRAFPHNRMLERGTPIILVAMRSRGVMSNVAREVRRLVPERDIGMNSSGTYTDSDDVIFTTYGTMDCVYHKDVGIFIGEIEDGADFSKRAEKISMLRNAYRWGVRTTPFGGGDVGMDIEGLFGPVTASATYSDAVRAGLGVPISVVWIRAPKPKTYIGPASLSAMARAATTGNPMFMDKVAAILASLKPCEKCAVVGDDEDLLLKIGASCDIPVLRQKMPKKEMHEIEDGVNSGTICKYCADRDFEVDGGPLVMVSTTCSGDVRNIPWRVKGNNGGRAVIVDFRHDWDVHNGRPGYLMLNDMARENRYREMGFVS